ncbi:MAG: lipoprotein-releasing ABC transporter permease subunit [Rickettsiales bacterium]|jgi:lipoprotein-releasing system permease protein|nr:lipoprotein-releasing ABC transporter permease subunit [Rickettsiales bacterium]
MANIEKFIAFRFLRSKKKDGFISLISSISLVGIALGVATLIVVMSVMGGFHKTLLGRIIGMNGHLVVYYEGGALKDYDFLISKIESNAMVMKNLVGIMPVAEGQVMVSANGNAKGAILRGARLGDLNRFTEVGKRLFGKDLDKVKEGELIMGSVLFRSLRIPHGEPATLMSMSGGQQTAFGTMPRVQSYPIVSNFKIGMYEYDAGFIFMPLESAQTFLNIPGGATHIDIFIKDPENTFAVKSALRGILPDGFVVRDWKELNAGFVGALEVEKNVMFLILMLIILVAAFNIISTLVMMVKDKGRDIAIMRTIGMPRSSVSRIFIINGTLTGFIGAFFGTTLGVLVAMHIEQIRKIVQHLTGRDLFPAEIYFLSELPAEINAVEVFAVFGFAVVLSFLATLYPARRAAKLEPAEVLKYE